MVKVEKIDREKAVQDVWKGIDAMRYWYIAGMGSLIVAAFTVVLTKVL